MFRVNSSAQQEAEAVPEGMEMHVEKPIDQQEPEEVEEGEESEGGAGHGTKTEQPKVIKYYHSRLELHYIVCRRLSWSSKEGRLQWISLSRGTTPRHPTAPMKLLLLLLHSIQPGRAVETAAVP